MSLEAKQQARAINQTNDINAHRVRANPKPLDDDLFSGAHGEIIYEKITTALAHSPTGLKVQALERINDILRKPDNIVLAIKHGVFAELALNLADQDLRVRELSSEALVCITRSKYGRDHTIEEDITPKLYKLLSDDGRAVRQNSYGILLNLCETPSGLLSVIQFGLLDTLILKISDEPEDEIKCLALAVIACCVQTPDGYKVAMGAELVPNLTTTLRASASDSALFHAAACNVYAFVAFEMPGKDAIVDEGAVFPICELLKSLDAKVREQASSALMHITIALQGKVQAIEANAVPLLIICIDDKVKIVAINCMQTLANLSEHPASRKDEYQLEADETMERLKYRSTREGEDRLVKMAATTCLEKIQWRP